tara:strand:+ start:435 stop:857 length:423 start_codon:yes stop_codon:yes gene_type:complete
MITCVLCKEEKSEVRFYSRGIKENSSRNLKVRYSWKSLWRGECKSCIKEKRRLIGNKKYDFLFKKQKGLCKICEKPPKPNTRLTIDHCHKTQVIRGLLCSNCNTALGLFKDNNKSMQKAISYLIHNEKLDYLKGVKNDTI